ncbi:hypothetical protein MPLB_1990074 [Mesorhizobium sp. ORS 3324]|nr:hypothetical protein MPLB_1990074 [Mesorhizobium sp. ORS 3324]
MGKGDYIELLRGMASADNRLLEQAPDGTTMLGKSGSSLRLAATFTPCFRRTRSGGSSAAGAPLAPSRSRNRPPSKS